MGRGRDSIDVVCECWARTRRELLGFRAPLRAQDCIGPLHCTLGARRDLHAGSRSEGRLEQSYPEVYLGTAALVNRAFWAMPETLRTMMDVHYVVERPRDKRARAELLGLSRDQYWDRLGRAKAFVEGALSVG